MIGGPPQPCPHCHRPTVLMLHGWGRQWVHVGTWRPQCGALSWATRNLDNLGNLDTENRPPQPGPQAA
jgi:hypothetical protein